jgi:hypothetical protein
VNQKWKKMQIAEDVGWAFIFHPPLLHDSVDAHSKLAFRLALKARCI